ncbi:MAG: hypothetical protein PHY59_00755 [Methanobacterium sp.]|nr:hypothetical protein [Methanobacterium sp.]
MKALDLNEKQKKLLLHLKPYSADLHEYYTDLYKKGISSDTGTFLNTYADLAKWLNISRDQLVNWIKGRGIGKENGLEWRGLVKTVKINPKSKTSAALVYLKPNLKNIQMNLTRDPKLSIDRETKLEDNSSHFSIDEVLKFFLILENKTNYEENFQHIKTYTPHQNTSLGENIKAYKKHIKEQKAKKMYERIKKLGNDLNAV